MGDKTGFVSPDPYDPRKRYLYSDIRTKESAWRAPRQDLIRRLLERAPGYHRYPTFTIA